MGIPPRQGEAGEAGGVHITSPYSRKNLKLTQKFKTRTKIQNSRKNLKIQKIKKFKSSRGSPYIYLIILIILIIFTLKPLILLDF